MSKQQEQAHQNAQLAEKCEERLKDEFGEQEPGQCWRFQRLNIRDVIGTNWPGAIPGPDALGAFNRFKREGWVLPKGANTIPGDLVFFGPTKGNPHGHVAMRIRGNRIGENYTPHAKTNNGDARGTRPLAGLTNIIGWVRIPTQK